jgi:hypothetical protein
MKKPTVKASKRSIKLSKYQIVLFGAVFLVAATSIGGLFAFKSHKQVAFEQQIQTSEQALKKDLTQAAEQNVKRIETEKQEQQKITDAEQAKKSADETQSVEDKAANRYSNVYGASKIYESTCGPASAVSGTPLNLSYDRAQLNSGAPFTVTISTPDGSALGQVFVNTNGGFTATPKSFSSSSNTSSFTAQYPPGYNPISSPGPSMNTGGAQPTIFVAAACGSRSLGAGISLF